MTGHLRYRPEIDGLRAVAVLSVVFFHAKIGFSGGFVGVDVFFVISGYLISTLILRDLEKGQFSMIDFWERRARRIMPALAAMVLAVLAGSYFVLLPEDLRMLGRSAAAQAVFGANFFFYSRAGDYFAGAAEEMPLLHTWSLAVEEQFYLVFPILLFLVFLRPGLRSRSRLLLVFGIVFLFSLGVGVFQTAMQPLAAFYLLPARAWELLAGSLLAFIPFHWNPAKRILRESFSYAGLLLIGFAVFTYSEDVPFPGIAALLPCLGTVLIIWANGAALAGPPESVPLTTLGRLLAWRPIVFIGLISYSLYLWHWPVLVLADYWMLEKPWWTRVLLVMASFILAVFSWRFVETPFRKKQWCASRSAIFTLTAATIAIAITCGIFFVRSRGLPDRFSSEVLEASRVPGRERAFYDHKIEDITNDRLVRFGAEDPNAPIKLLIWGDSHARQAVPAFDNFAEKHGFAGRVIAHGASSPLFDHTNPSVKSMRGDSDEWAEAVLEYVKKNKISDVVLIARWERDLKESGPAELKKSLLNTIEIFNRAGTSVYVMLQPPSHDRSVPKLLAWGKLMNEDIAPELRTPEEHYRSHKLFYDMARENQDPMAFYLDPAKYFLAPDGRHFIVDEEGHPLYSDTSHITMSAAAKYLGRMLEGENFDPLADNAAAAAEKK